MDSDSNIPKPSNFAKWLIVALVVAFVLGGGVLFVMLPSDVNVGREAEDLTKVDLPPSHPEEEAAAAPLPGVPPGFFDEDDEEVAAQMGQILNGDEQEYPTPFAEPDPNPAASPDLTHGNNSATTGE